jgi:threonine dehydratase
MDLQDIRQAADRIKPYVRRTPLEQSLSLSEKLGTNVFVKYELFQKTGSFKARGAFNKMLLMGEIERGAGVVAVSGGNHAQAVGYAANILGIDAVIVMPENTPQNYVDATRGYGAVVDLQPTIAAAFDKIAEYKDAGRTFIHPFDDPQIMAGQGTLGLEIINDLPDVTDVVISIGGGGFLGGVSTALKELKPDVRIWGVETFGADTMSQAFAAGHPVEIAVTSIAKTLGAPYVTEATLEIAQRNLESITVVPDSDAVDATLFIAERLKVITEPAAACTLAAAERLKSNFDQDTKLLLILCGGNTSIRDVCGYLNG